MDCIYYDYTDKNVDEWGASLANSEVNNYSFLQKDIATHTINGTQYIKVYSNNCVSTYEVRND